MAPKRGCKRKGGKDHGTSRPVPTLREPNLNPTMPNPNTNLENAENPDIILYNNIQIMLQKYPTLFPFLNEKYKLGHDLTQPLEVCVDALFQYLSTNHRLLPHFLLFLDPATDVRFGIHTQHLRSLSSQTREILDHLTTVNQEPANPNVDVVISPRRQELFDAVHFGTTSVATVSCSPSEPLPLALQRPEKEVIGGIPSTAAVQRPGKEIMGGVPSKTAVQCSGKEVMCRDPSTAAVQRPGKEVMGGTPLTAAVQRLGKEIMGPVQPLPMAGFEAPKFYTCGRRGCCAAFFVDVEQTPHRERDHPPVSKEFEACFCSTDNMACLLYPSTSPRFTALCEMKNCSSLRNVFVDLSRAKHINHDDFNMLGGGHEAGRD
ncbi:hypothetical protein PanWU01x14_338730 [Parasponia andersonii]|uniref:Uncharacterized protein n=1 Tax=Parasponia andersonii TaxID=3476 RepID=A0A2P5AF09_PARAD|nr:hypothetical protein PanWU01x14_338730 [Parasponia andersonii]